MIATPYSFRVSQSERPDLKKGHLSYQAHRSYRPKIENGRLAALPAVADGTRPDNPPPRRKGTRRYDQYTHPLGTNGIGRRRKPAFAVLRAPHERKRKRRYHHC